MFISHVRTFVPMILLERIFNHHSSPNYDKFATVMLNEKNNCYTSRMQCQQQPRGSTKRLRSYNLP